MEFKRNSVIGLYLAGKSQKAIVNELRHLHVNKMFVYRTISRYNDTGSIKKRHGGGHPKTATSPGMVRKVKIRIQRNPRQSAVQLAKNLNVSARSIGRILKNELRLKTHKVEKVQDLKPAQEAVRLAGANVLKALHTIRDITGNDAENQHAKIARITDEQPSRDQIEQLIASNNLNTLTAKQLKAYLEGNDVKDISSATKAVLIEKVIEYHS